MIIANPVETYYLFGINIEYELPYRDVQHAGINSNLTLGYGQGLGAEVFSCKIRLTDSLRTVRMETKIYETTHYCHEKNQTETPHDTMMPQKKEKVKNRSGNCCILGLLGMFWHAHLSITWRIPGEQAGKKIARASKNDQKHGFHWIYTEDFDFQQRVWILQIQSVILVILVSKLRTCWPDGPGRRKKTRAPQSLSSGCPLWGT